MVRLAVFPLGHQPRRNTADLRDPQSSIQPSVMAQNFSPELLWECTSTLPAIAPSLVANPRQRAVQRLPGQAPLRRRRPLQPRPAEPHQQADAEALRLPEPQGAAARLTGTRPELTRQGDRPPPRLERRRYRDHEEVQQGPPARLRVAYGGHQRPARHTEVGLPLTKFGVGLHGPEPTARSSAAPPSGTTARTCSRSPFRAPAISATARGRRRTRRSRSCGARRRRRRRREVTFGLALVISGGFGATESE
jgi:hypothetical protein